MVKGAEVGAGVGRLVRIEVDPENPSGHVSLLQDLGSKDKTRDFRIRVKCEWI